MTAAVSRRQVLAAGAAATLIAATALAAAAATDPALVLYNEWRSLADRLNDPATSPAEADAVFAAMAALDRRLAETPAASVAGIAGKLVVGLAHIGVRDYAELAGDYTPEDRLLLSAMLDAERLAGPALPALAQRRR